MGNLHEMRNEKTQTSFCITILTPKVEGATMKALKQVAFHRRVMRAFFFFFLDANSCKLDRIPPGGSIQNAL